MATKMKISDLGKMFEGLDTEAFEGISIEGDIEFEPGSDGMNPQAASVLGQESAQIALHFANLANLLGIK